MKHKLYILFKMILYKTHEHAMANNAITLAAESVYL